MGRSINGYLMLGWEVEIEDAKNYDDYGDGLTDEAERRIDEIVGIVSDWSYPIEFYSSYGDCDEMWVGLRLMSNDGAIGYYGSLDVGEYGLFLLNNSEVLVEKACAIYEAVMGERPDEEPRLMCFGTEG